MTGIKRVQDMDIPKAANKEILRLWAAIQDIDQKVTEQVPAIVTNGAVEKSLIHDSIGM
jgi:hypothetical protein